MQWQLIYQPAQQCHHVYKSLRFLTLQHNLQVLQAGDVAGLHVVSGAGAPERVSTVTNLPDSIFAHAAPGFVVLDFGQRDGLETVILRVVENGFDRPVFEMNIPL